MSDRFDHALSRAAKRFGPIWTIVKWFIGTLFFAAFVGGIYYLTTLDYGVMDKHRVGDTAQYVSLVILPKAFVIFVIGCLIIGLIERAKKK